MDDIFFAYATILCVSSLVLFGLYFLPGIRALYRALMRNRLLMAGLVLICSVFYWPGEMGQAYQAGDMLGAARIVRLLVFVGLFCLLFLYALSRSVFPKHSYLYVYLIYIAFCINFFIGFWEMFNFCYHI